MLKFEIDNQTLKDIEIFDSANNKRSVFSIFNSTRSMGGKNRLYTYFKTPLTDLTAINDRKNAIAFFQELTITHNLSIDKNTLDFIEYYLQQEGYPTTPPNKLRAIEKAIYNKLKPSNEYYIIEKGIGYTVDFLLNIYHFALKLQNYDCPEKIRKNNSEIFRIFNLPEFIEIININKMGALNIAKLDYIIRYTHKDAIRFLLDIIYDYDVFITVSQVSKKKGYSYPEILPVQEYIIEANELYDPFIKEPIKNNINLTSQNNLLFITGPNMAGKSSLLKSLAIASYLAHIGFPVPATTFKISLLSGIYTTINISDNLNLGYSHFYAEVLRIKSISEKLKKGNNALVIFDELFRGTNVKDAYDGSLAIISAFSEVRSCFFAISTHILEVTDKLKEINTIQFRYMEVINKNESPQYTYLLKSGISDHRMGMYIIEKENIVNIIKSIVPE